MEEKEIIEIIKESFTINSICEKVYGYSNKGTIEKIKKIIDKYELNIDHFCRGKNNRKYEVIKKLCPICSLEFETRKGHKREKITCSNSCSIKYFQHGVNNKNFDLEKYELRKEEISKSLRKNKDIKNKFYSFSEEEIEEIKNLFEILKNFKSVSQILNVSISCIKTFVNYEYKKVSIKEKKINNLYRRKKLKEILVDYKGGKCSVCGYNKCIRALEFHHKDPTQKDFNISASHLSLDKLKKEADKCILLCSNCHREIHSKIDDENNFNNFEEKQNNLKLKQLDKKTKCDCGNLKSRNSKICVECYRKNQYNKKPKLEKLLQDVEELGYSETGRKYGVSDNMIRKWIKNIIKYENR